ncbi:2-amino-4-hydroxy-6-hydroxymethyldihydropteridine diphosphokinase [Leucobacter sp. OH1287]|uniref:2-amino-4-hydroxy-6- hydroxymethyldihydropteridine diphosphokinase n=1 Tax=Leucobacter sp. OH1287 TaxID=2491049 RepID=UPI000F5FFC64|nr:2-amino-4-hydroxy-6-hydroxymethyldihydropteridine diphosphokinase [Leucobacter sp. OH1287]RRD61314.1 2-amino-4-hydroxy-6-hydroxymethyldihydropteridine diphosphokinase [Leucobacter sp. OH1287]
MIAQFAPIVLAFGANLGDREAVISAAFAELQAHPQISEFQASPLRQSVALTVAGRDEQAPRYLNAIATAVTTLTAPELLRLVQQIETKHGRVRDTRWGDRTLDIDIIVYAGKVQRTPELTLPHPEAHLRDFVLSPWLLLDPGAALPRHGRVRDLLAQIGDTTEPYLPDPPREGTVSDEP